MCANEDINVVFFVNCLPYFQVIPYVKPVKPVCTPLTEKVKVKEVMGIPCPIPDYVNSLPAPSIDNLRHAVWTPNNTQVRPQQESVGFDSLRFAIWTPENTPKPEEYTYKPPEVNYQIISKIGVVSLNPYHNPTTCGTYMDEEEGEEEEENTWQIMPIKHTAVTPPGDDKVIYEMDPQGHHPDVMKLQTVLQNMYPALDELITKSPDGFQPHLTLGQCPKTEVLKFIDQLKEVWKDVTFEVSNVCVISRKGQNDPFKVKKQIPLESF